MVLKMRPSTVLSWQAWLASFDTRSIQAKVSCWLIDDLASSDLNIGRDMAQVLLRTMALLQRIIPWL